MPPSYDAATGTVYLPTAVPVPWGQKPSGTKGDLKWTNPTLALDVDTGEIKWARQHIPNDNFDLDTAFERHVLTSRVEPDVSEVRWIADTLPEQERKLLFGKSGIVRAMDAQTGELYWARETYHQTGIADIDMGTGEASLNADPIAKTGETVTACPSLYGGRNWPGDAVDGERGLYFVAYNNTCMEYTLNEAEIELGEYHESGSFTNVHAPDRRPEGEEEVGTVLALDIQTGREVWRHNQRAPWYGAILATGGGLVFGGGVDRTFRAFHSETGDVLWSIRLTTSAQGFPVTYDVDGVQYLAVPAGYGLAFPEFTPEVPQPNEGASLFVFRLRESDGR